MNAIILAAGLASSFVPLSLEKPKGLLEVKGEILIERQIRQLKEAGVDEITVVTGYKSYLFDYLQNLFGVDLVYNEDYNKYNNSSSVFRVIDRLSDTFLCCSDHYFCRNVFSDKAKDSYYAARFAGGTTGEYCLETDVKDYITGVSIGGSNAWYMAGHAFLNDTFSRTFRDIMRREYVGESVRKGYWEDVYIKYIKYLPMRIRRYSERDIFEFDSLDELRSFDNSYIWDTRSSILKSICSKMSWKEADVTHFSKQEVFENRAVFSIMHQRDSFRITWTPNIIMIEKQ